MARAPAAHLKAVYTTATAPLARSDLLGHLQGESIHEKLDAAPFNDALRARAMVDARLKSHRERESSNTKPEMTETDCQKASPR